MPTVRTFISIPCFAKVIGSSDDVAEPAAKVKTKSKVSSAQSEESKLPTPALFQASLLPKPNKLDALSRADGLARGFILLGIGSSGAEEGWSWVLEGQDEPTPCEPLPTASPYLYLERCADTWG